MNRLQEIADSITKEELAKYPEGCPREIGEIAQAEKAMHKLLEAIKPEIELMLKEQAKIVRHAACDEAQKYQNEKHLSGNLPSRMINLCHDWVKLEDKWHYSSHGYWSTTSICTELGILFRSLFGVCTLKFTQVNSRNIKIMQVVEYGKVKQNSNMLPLIPSWYLFNTYLMTLYYYYYYIYILLLLLLT